MLELDIIKSQWRGFDQAVFSIFFLETHFYTTLKWMAIHLTCGKHYTRNILVDHASGTKYGVTDACR